MKGLGDQPDVGDSHFLMYLGIFKEYEPALLSLRFWVVIGQPARAGLGIVDGPGGIMPTVVI
jgi:hypothetical protein